MKEQLDLVKILKDCPKGMELDCTMYDNVTLKSVSDDPDNTYPICIEMKCNFIARLTKYGQNACIDDAKCVIFPKGKKTWEGFQRPFVDGDIVFYNDTIAIFKEWGDETLFKTYVTKYLCCDSLIDINVPLFGKSIRKEIRFATEKEKQILFDAIKEYGYKWDTETKILEKLIEPKFKVGDRVQSKIDNNDKFTITNIDNNKFYYGCGNGHEFMIPVVKQDNWELVPNKFDPKTLKPFHKVLVRDIGYNTRWHIQFFETMYDDKKYPFMCLSGKIYSFCIPYNDDTKHLVGKSEEAPEFYKYWEN